MLGVAQLERISVSELRGDTMPCNENPRPFTRREALGQIGGGFGLVAFANMINTSLKAADTSGGHARGR